MNDDCPEDDDDIDPETQAAAAKRLREYQPAEPK
jgi:hypothetical protein